MQNKKVLIKAKHTNNSYYNINTINAVETAELQSILNKYKNIEGDYSVTMLQGIAHYKCDSGIQTDAYSKADAEYIYSKNMDDETDAFYAWLDKNVSKIQFLQCLHEQYTFSEKYMYDDEEIANLLANMEEEQECNIHNKMWGTIAKSYL
jgi:hypothetical protein